MNWIAVSSVVTAMALVVQLGVLIALFLELRKTTEKVNSLTSDLRTRIGPILTRVQILLDDTSYSLIIFTDLTNMNAFNIVRV